MNESRHCDAASPETSPGLRVVSEDIEKGVDAGFELPGSKNVREMGNVALPPVRQKTGVTRQQLHNRATALGPAQRTRSSVVMNAAASVRRSRPARRARTCQPGSACWTHTCGPPVNPGPEHILIPFSRFVKDERQRARAVFPELQRYCILLEFFSRLSKVWKTSRIKGGSAETLLLICPEISCA